MDRRVPAQRPDGSSEEIRVQTPGMSAAVAVDGRIVWSEGFGLAELENEVRVTPATRFRIGSVSKLITAAAVMRLVDAGRMELDAPVRRYTPVFPEKRHPITIRQLAGHQSGIRHYRPDDPVGQRAFPTLAAGLEVFAADSLQFTPGTKYLYSSYGYNLLGVAIEGASGEPFLSFVRREVLHPLGMQSTVADHRDSVVAGRSGFYQLGRGMRIVNAPYDDVSYKWPSGGFLSTAEDLVRLGSAFLGPGFLSQASLLEMFTPQRLASGEPTVVGIGWRIGTDPAGRTFYHHGGASTGGRAVLVVYPRERVVAAVASNLRTPIDERDLARLAQLFLGTAGSGRAVPAKGGP
ncbi:MAG TPA: serine hydrolase domain-containing protein [Longimicrobiaceae bacterium]|nr:serine hydrolase domain-containing protein [Longimicrobiaceae bacterium]